MSVGCRALHIITGVTHHQEGTKDFKKKNVNVEFLNLHL